MVKILRYYSTKFKNVFWPQYYCRYELAENQQVQDCNSNEEKEKNEPIGVITKELSEDYNLG